MNQGYCGKDCTQCTAREQLNCPGCQNGPGRTLSDECEIALCCRSKNHQCCDTCTNSRYCGKRSRRDNMPERRAQKAAAEAEKMARLKQTAPFLGKWLGILFWLIIPSTLASLLSTEALADFVPELYLFGKILTTLCSLAYGGILLRLSGHCSQYLRGGICRLVAAAAGVLIAFNASNGKLPNGLMVLVLIIGALAGIVSSYFEFTGHSAVLEEVNREQSRKWSLLWKWTIAAYIAPFASLLLMLISVVLGLIVFMLTLLGMVAVNIVALVYLYKTAKIFREYGK